MVIQVPKLWCWLLSLEWFHIHWASTPVSAEHMMSTWCPFSHPHLTHTLLKHGCLWFGGVGLIPVHLRVNPERGNCGKEVQLEMMIKREGITWHFLSPSAQGITQCVHTIASLVQGFLPETPTTIDHHFGCRQPHRNRLNEEKLHAHAVFISPAISSNLDSNLQHRHCDHVCSLERMYHNFFHSQSVSQTGRHQQLYIPRTLCAIGCMKKNYPQRRYKPNVD